jgi:hypothetical protein
MDDLDTIYQELEAFIRHLPKGGYVEVSFAHDFNGLVDQLSAAAHEQFETYKLEESKMLGADVYYSRGARLLAKVNAKHQLGALIPDFRDAVSISPVSIHQSNSQEVNTTIIISIVSEITEQLTRKEAEFPEGSKERNFIDKVKAGVKTVKDASGLIALVLAVGQQAGLDASQIAAMFHH